MGTVSDYLRVAGRNICVFIIGIVLGVLLLWGSFFLPHKPIDYHVEISSYMMMEEGMYPWLVSETVASVMDNFTDAIMISGALVDAPDGEELNYAMMAYHESNDGFPHEALRAHYEDPSSLHLASYERYWHGYLVLLKLLLQRFSLQEIRLINTSCQMALVFLILYILSKKKMQHLFAPLFIGTLSLFPAAVGLSLQFSTVFYIAYIASVLVLLCGDCLDGVKGGWATFFLIVGMLTSYLDFLTYPVITLGLPLFFFFAQKPPRVKEYGWIQQFVSCTFHWCLGYGAFWAAKWVVGSVLTGKDMIASSIDNVALRASRSLHSMPLTLSKVLESCWEAMNSNLALRYIILLWVVGYTVCIVYKLVKGQMNLSQLKDGCFAALPMILCAILPVGWYFFTENHSYNHSWYTFRALSVAVLACTAFFSIVLNSAKSSSPADNT